MKSQGTQRKQIKKFQRSEDELEQNKGACISRINKNSSQSIVVIDIRNIYTKITDIKRTKSQNGRQNQSNPTMFSYGI